MIWKMEDRRMGIVIREYQTEDVTAAITIWNQVVEDGVAFPQEENLTEETGDAFFKEQTYTGIAVNTDNNEIVGLYILHPNNVGRCGHICNASYTVRRDFRGTLVSLLYNRSLRWSVMQGRHLLFRE
jgi:hypothetical protein